ncbi:DUF2490 domain-containing protein [Flavobacterium columnare]|uniref:DUF2490 domain-containing protein n=1 Tax=Flavobacterium columnare TaxID=996 RepID=UPI002D20E892|nr:DUF2490 domain-containing protein [Flavobacterium columnare]MEB3800002.1 DUF2490 domain-containing protein [Flavobacterium columnare]
MKKNLLILLLVFSIGNVLGQNEEHLSGFSTLSLTYKFNKKWYVYGELQARSIADLTTVDYYEVKGGSGYNINSSNQAFLGLGRYANYREKSISNEELRFWLQYTYAKTIGRVKFENRMRGEKRLFHNPITGINTNTERYRDRINVIIPINNKKVDANTFFVNAYDELFLGPDNPVIKRNRMYAGGGYQLSKYFGVSLGYLFQRDFGLKTNTNLHFIFCGLNFTIDKSNSAPVEAPTPDHD